MSTTAARSGRLFIAGRNMNKTKRIVPWLLLLICALMAGAQNTQITASHVSYFGGTTVTGQMCLTPTNQAGQPINIVTPLGQQVSPQIPLCFKITSGVLASNAVVPDTSQTQPANACYNAVISNFYGAQVAVFPCIQPSGSTWSFDAFVPSSMPAIPALQLPQFKTNGVANASQTSLNLVCTGCTESPAGTINIPSGSGSLPSASASNMVPVSTAAGTTYNAAAVPVSFGTAASQYIQQQVTNSNYTTLNVNSLNDEIWVEGFAGGPYTGIGQPQVAWVTATNYPLCQNVSYSGGNYVAITYPNSSVTPTSNVTVWWPKATSDATTEADCAFASAAGKAAATSKQQTLRAGSGSWNMTGWIEPGGLYSVNVKGCGIFCSTWNYTGTGAVPMLQRPTGGSYTFLDVSDAYWEPNQVASSIFDLGALNQSHFDNMQWDNPAPLGTGNSGNFFARFGETGGDGFQVYPNNITMGTSPTNHNTATVTANVVGGSITSYTVSSGGSGYIAAGANNIYYVQVNGYKAGTSYQPCTVMPVGQAVTVVSGVITAVSEGSNTGGSGCSGTIDVAVYTYFPVQYGIYNNASDSTLKDITIYASSPYGAGIYDNGGDTHHIHIHPSFITNGIATICANDTYESTELDNVYNQGFQFNQPFAGTGCSVTQTHAYGASAKGNTPYYFASALAQVAIGTSGSLSGGTNAADWHEFVTQSGTIDAPTDWATKAPSGLTVTGNDLSAGEVNGDWIPVLNTGALKATTFNPTSISSQTIYNSPTGTATTGTNLGSSGNFGPQTSYCTGSPCAPATSTATQTLTPGTGTNPGLSDVFDIYPCPSLCSFYFDKPLVETTTFEALHYIGHESPAPTVAPGTGAGTSPTVAVVAYSSDLSGWITVTTGTSPTASATVATLTFGTAYAYPGPKCSSYPANPATAALVGVAQANMFPAGATTTTQTLTQGSAALAASTAYEWSYTCTN
jgi:hypothetical protein